MRHLVMIAGFLAASAAVAQDKPVLTVYTYDSFVTEWGPGPAVEAGFEETCGCDVEFVAAGDGAALLARLLIEGNTTRADVVLGLDQNLIAEAMESGVFSPHGMDKVAFDVPTTWDDPVFVPFDWGYFAFVYDKARLDAPPDSFEALAASDVKILIQDPRSSTPGLGLLYWVKAAYGERAGQIWSALADNIVTVTPGWSEAYGLFLAGEADMVLSYTTSPAYHLIAESDDSKAAAMFSEGHYLQVEVAAKVGGSDVPGLADAFLKYMVGEAFQSALPETNWMYPAVIPLGGLPKGFDTLSVPEVALMLSPDEAAAVRDIALDEWLTALAR